MKKVIRWAIIVSWLLAFSLPASARSKSGLHFFVGTSNQLTFPGTLRVGWEDWEMGMLHPTAYGATKLFFAGESLYSTLGVAATTQGDLGLGLAGSIGFDYELIWGIGLRSELFAVYSYNGYSLGVGIVGLSYDF
ncbi:MAG: hypothetical protein IT288_07995 [Bdellovibrionales bacterium]|nr:hypothetical protein [Bdellovibrionales bacterium]